MEFNKHDEENGLETNSKLDGETLGEFQLNFYPRQRRPPTLQILNIAPGVSTDAISFKEEGRLKVFIQRKDKRSRFSKDVYLLQHYLF